MVLYLLFIEPLINNDASQIIRDIACFCYQIRGHFGEVLKLVSACHQVNSWEIFMFGSLIFFSWVLIMFLEMVNNCRFLEELSLWRIL